MKASVQRLRAEVRSDRNAWSSCVEELEKVDLDRGDAGALAQAAVALHHGYGAIESALERVARALKAHDPPVARRGAVQVMTPRGREPPDVTSNHMERALRRFAAN